MSQEAYIQGISTRSVDDLVKAMGMSGISKSRDCQRFRAGSGILGTEVIPHACTQDHRDIG